MTDPRLLAVNPDSASPFPPGPVERLVRAVQALLDHRVARPVNTGELKATLLNWNELMTRDPVDDLISRLKSDPTEEGLRQYIRLCGYEIYCDGGDKALHAAANVVEDCCGTRGAIIVDHRFDGIGLWVA